MLLVVAAAGGLKSGPPIPPEARPAIVAEFRRLAVLKRGHGAHSSIPESVAQPSHPPPPAEFAPGSTCVGAPQVNTPSVPAHHTAFLDHFPWLREEPEDVQALVYSQGQQAAQDHPEWPFNDVLRATVEALHSSALPRATAIASRLDPLGTRASGPQPSSNRLSTSILTHEPLLATSDTPGMIWAFGEQCRVLDLGEEIDGRTGQCVILSLAAAVGVPPRDLLTSFELEAEASLCAYREFTPPHISWSAHQALAHAHDFRAAALAASKGDTSTVSFDIHLARFFFSALFSSRRLVLLVHTLQGVEIHVITGRLFEQGRRPGSAHTACFFLSDGHCQLFNPGMRFGGASPGAPFKRLCSDADVDAWLASTAAHGLIPRDFQQHDPVADSSAPIPTVSLGACKCCGLRLDSRLSTAGRTTAPTRVPTAQLWPDAIGCQALRFFSGTIGAGLGGGKESLIEGADECDSGTHASTAALQTPAHAPSLLPAVLELGVHAMDHVEAAPSTKDKQAAHEGGPAQVLPREEANVESTGGTSGLSDDAGLIVEAPVIWQTRPIGNLAITRDDRWRYDFKDPTDLIHPGIAPMQAKHSAGSRFRAAQGTEQSQGHTSTKATREQRWQAAPNDVDYGGAPLNAAQGGECRGHPGNSGVRAGFAVTAGGAVRQIVDLRMTSRKEEQGSSEVETDGLGGHRPPLHAAGVFGTA